MDASIRQRLMQLKELAQPSGNSEVPIYVLESIVENVAKLLDADASNRKVADKLIGGLRAIMDASSSSVDAPIVSRILLIIDDAMTVGLDKRGE